MVLVRVARGAVLWAQRIYSVRENVLVGDGVHFGPLSIAWAPDSLVIEDDVYIGKYCTIECNGRIGSGSMIANSVGLVGRHDHDVSAVGTTVRNSPWVGNDKSDGPREEIIVGPDVWIGFGSILLAPVNVGRGAVVAAGSVVTRDVQEYAVVAGNPAVKIGDRFSRAEIERHEEILLRKGQPRR